MSKIQDWFCKNLGLFCPKRPTIDVQECKSSRLLPNAPLCPTPYMTERYYQNPKQGEPVAPTSKCNVHVAPIYPPVADGKSPRTGVDVYQLIAFRTPEITQYLDDLVRNGGSALRVFMIYTWPKEDTNSSAGWHYSPYVQVGWYFEDDPQSAFYGGKFPVYDLEQWNEPIWNKWRYIFRACRERNIELTVSVIDGCSFTDFDQRHHPLVMNHQHLGAEQGLYRYTEMDGVTPKYGKGEHTGGLFGGFGGADGNMKSYVIALWYKVAYELATNMGDSQYRIGTNEVYVPGDNWSIPKNPILKDYLETMIGVCVEGEAKTRQIVMSIAGDHDRTQITVPLMDKYPGVVEQLHGPNSPETLSSWMAKFPRSEMDGDGFDNNAEGYSNDYNYTMPSIDQCREMRNILINAGTSEYHIFNGYIEGRGWQDITKAGWDEQRALAGKEGK